MSQPLPVPPADPGPITDDILACAIRVADQALTDDQLTDDGAALILWIAAPALRELLQWRRRMAVIGAVATAGNVVVLPGGRA